MKKKMTFSRLVEKIATETRTSKKLIHDLLIETVALNQEGLQKDAHSSISGLGRFSLRWHKARKGHNPKSGETIDIPGHNTINFKPQVSLRNHINRHYSQLKPIPFEAPKKDLEEEITTPKAKDSSIPIAKSVQTKQTEALVPEVERKKEEASKIDKVPEKVQSSVTKQKKPITKWIWPIILFLFIILFYLFWSASDTSDTELKEKPTTETPLEVKKPTTETPTTEQKKEAIKTPEKKIVRGVAASKYTLKNGDYLYRIAQDYYKEASFWPLIYKANKSLSPNPEIVITGREINLPALEGNLKNLTIQDKKNIAEGYLEVYLYYKDKNHTKAIYHLWVAKKMEIPNIIEDNAERINRADLNTLDKIEGELKLEVNK